MNKTLREFTIEKLKQGYSQAFKIASLYAPQMHSPELVKLAEEVAVIIEEEWNLENE